MSIGLVGRKCGMTRVFTEDGASIPVTVVEVMPNLVTQLKTDEVDGYVAIQITTGARKANRVTKPVAGHFAKAKVNAGRGLWEFRLKDGETVSLAVGDALTVSHFNAGQMVDVTGVSKGKGYAGAIKRHNFSSQDASHGNSLSHNAPGSIGQNQSPGKVFKGKRMSGHMGDVKVTTQNLQVVRIDVERNAILIKGAIPGAPGGDVIIRAACKYKTKMAAAAAASTAA
jgi:large subunit ribosomal protein L3